MTILGGCESGEAAFTPSKQGYTAIPREPRLKLYDSAVTMIAKIDNAVNG